MSLPIEQGVAVGVLLSVLHGVWTTTRARTVEFERIPGTSVWWPETRTQKAKTCRRAGHRASGATVVSQRLQFPRAIDASAVTIRPETDRDGSECARRDRLLRREGLPDLVGRLPAKAWRRRRAAGIRAEKPSFARLGFFALLGSDHLFHSVQEAIDALGGAGRRLTRFAGTDFVADETTLCCVEAAWRRALTRTRSRLQES